MFQRIPIEESLSCPPICLIRCAGLPLTPAAEYFSDMLRRACPGSVAPDLAPA